MLCFTINHNTACARSMSHVHMCPIEGLELYVLLPVWRGMKMSSDVTGPAYAPSTRAALLRKNYQTVTLQLTPSGAVTSSN